MLTTDFTGTYDYEAEEAKNAANYILDDLANGYIEPGDLLLRMLKELAHWREVLPDTFDDFNKHFRAFIKDGLPAALDQFIEQSNS
jgi:hypothetical protein